MNRTLETYVLKDGPPFFFKMFFEHRDFFFTYFDTDKPPGAHRRTATARCTLTNRLVHIIAHSHFANPGFANEKNEGRET